MLRSGLQAIGGFELAPARIFAMLTHPLCLSGLIMHAIAAMVWFRALSMIEVSVGYPTLVSLTFLIVTMGALIFFGEAVSWRKIAGLAMILGGVQVVSRG